jgi:hypothetical protein
LQTSLDGGATAIDVACCLFNTISDRRIFNLTANVPAPIGAVTDSFLADDTLLNGILGTQVRLKLLTTGIYQNTVLAGRIAVR